MINMLNPQEMLFWMVQQLPPGNKRATMYKMYTHDNGPLPEGEWADKIRELVNEPSGITTDLFDNLVEYKLENCITVNTNKKRTRAFQGDTYTIQEFSEANGVIRLCVQRNDLTDGISWDTLQEIKNACGYADFDAVEVYPRQIDVLNIDKYRHIWIMPEPLPYAWRVDGNVVEWQRGYLESVQK